MLEQIVLAYLDPDWAEIYRKRTTFVTAKSAVRLGLVDVLRRCKSRCMNPVSQLALVDVATSCGNVEALSVLRSWGATYRRKTILLAATHGQIAAIDYLVQWSENNWHRQMASRGEEHYSFLTKCLDGIALVSAFCNAARRGHNETLVYLRDHFFACQCPSHSNWSMPFTWAIRNAASTGQISTMQLLQEWCANDNSLDLGAALTTARKFHQAEACAWLTHRIFPRRIFVSLEQAAASKTLQCQVC